MSVHDFAAVDAPSHGVAVALSVSASLTAASDGAPPVTELTPAEVRLALEATAAYLFGPTDQLGAVVDRALPGPVRIRIYQPSGSARELPVLVYFHGGGWVVGDLDNVDCVCRSLCRGAGCVVVSVDYRLAPENRFPAGSDDCFAAARWLSEHASELNADPLAAIDRALQLTDTVVVAGSIFLAGAVREPLRQRAILP